MKCYRTFCVLIIAILWTPALVKADILISPPTWAEIETDSTTIDISVDSNSIGVKIHRAIRIAKLSNHNYHFSDTVSSLCGALGPVTLTQPTTATAILSIPAPDRNDPDTFNISFVDETEIGESVLVSYNYSYQYVLSSLSQSIGGFCYGQEIQNAWDSVGGGEWAFATPSQITVKSNVDFISSPWDEPAKYLKYEANPLEINLRIFWDLSFLADGETDWPATVGVQETLYYNLAPEDWQDILSLINEEKVMIKFDKASAGYDYYLRAQFELNVDTVKKYDPSWAWFPNSKTNATAKLECLYDHTSGGEMATESKIIYCEVRKEQTGFYIKIPELDDTADPDDTWICKEATLIVSIDDVSTGNMNDYVVVTTPMQPSSIKFMIPRDMYFVTVSSPFEFTHFTKEGNYNVVIFNGSCFRRDTIHVEWSSEPPSLDNVVVYPNPYMPNSNPTHKRIIFTGFLSDQTSTIRIFNIAGELVRTIRNDGQGKICWQADNTSGKELSSGVYVYLIINENGEKKTGKIAIIK